MTPGTHRQPLAQRFPRPFFVGLRIAPSNFRPAIQSSNPAHAVERTKSHTITNDTWAWPSVHTLCRTSNATAPNRVAAITTDTIN